MNRSDVIGGSAVALTEALPFVAGIPRVYLVSDAIDTNGRFLLYTLASQVLSSASNNSNDKKKGRVLWLGCGPLTEEQILQGLRKIGCDRSVLANNTSTQANNKEPKSLTIRSLCVELSHKMLLQDDNYQDINKVFMKELMQFVDQWLLLDNNSNNETGTPWIILDDVSTLANLVREQLVYQFILQLNAKSHAGGDGVTTSSPGLILRCSNDQEDESLPVYSGASLKGHQAWFGAGGASTTPQQQQAIHSEGPPWERSLVELADGVMDVLPLASGYTRELHGRIVLTEMPFGRGWRHNNKQQSAAAAIRNTHSKKAYPAMQIVNYCITDQNPKIVAYIM